MNILFIILKFVFNIFLFLFYSLVSIIAWDFLICWLIPKVFDLTVPWVNDPVHLRIAILSVALVLIFTLLLRKYFYLNIFIKWKKDKSEVKNEKKWWGIKDMGEEELEIYINKEIK